MRRYQAGAFQDARILKIWRAEDALLLQTLLFKNIEETKGNLSCPNK